jgi:hypothetical protein
MVEMVAEEAAGGRKERGGGARGGQNERIGDGRGVVVFGGWIGRPHEFCAGHGHRCSRASLLGDPGRGRQGARGGASFPSTSCSARKVRAANSRQQTISDFNNLCRPACRFESFRVQAQWRALLWLQERFCVLLRALDTVPRRRRHGPRLCGDDIFFARAPIGRRPRPAAPMCRHGGQRASPSCSPDTVTSGIAGLLPRRPSSQADGRFPRRPPRSMAMSTPPSPEKSAFPPTMNTFWIENLTAAGSMLPSSTKTASPTSSKLQRATTSSTSRRPTTSTWRAPAEARVHARRAMSS